MNVPLDMAIRLVVLGAVLLAGCLPREAPLPPPTETPVPSASPTTTATTVWFPPTATPTPFPTLPVTPTPDLRPSLGEVLFSDDFSEGGPWALARTSAGSVALGKNELTIAIAEPKAYLSSLRAEPLLKDFYLEITASPTLCRQADEYGVLLRVASESDFYRFSLSCDGQVRLVRVFKGAASAPQPWLSSGAVPPGAPSTSRLAIWAKGKEMRFFVNDVHQFTISDPTIPSGNLGVFARSAGENAVTVNFTDLVVREIRD